MPLLTGAASNAKTRKALTELSIEAVILHLAPSTLARDDKSVCPWATAGCIAACLNTSGHGQFRGELKRENVAEHHIHRARIRRTLEFWDNRGNFVDRLALEIFNLSRRAAKKGYRAAARLNGTSDIPWESVGSELFHTFPEVEFYDYTKSRNRALAFARGEMPSNYSLTFSRSEKTADSDILEIVDAGCNVAVVFGGAELPRQYLGIPVLDGLKHDFRFLDPRNHIVGLLEKARAKSDESGFVVRLGKQLFPLNP